ncbi:Protein rds1 [Lachnellula subtilissima]|uniref:Protein rds1 n=1 Tax=Lachnellula subtilissima TaxID=602034 RepID=A0A8H8RUN9_9HELO|nr:Protein rds1 [Lachnellula subtilissima]
MKYSVSIAALAAASMVSAGPIAVRQASTDIDVTILNYALTLEHLEDKFYREGLANYSQADFANAGFDATFYANLKEVSYDESTHVNFLTKALGSAATAECIYSFPSTDPKSFVALAAVLEGVGITAYLGAAALITNADYLTAAGSILTVESRHNAYLRAAQKQSPFPQPFDVPLDFDEVYSLASAFIVSCPATNPTLPVKAFAPLALSTTGTVKSGDVITVATPGYTLAAANGKDPVYAAFITVTGPLISVATPTSGGFLVTVPTGINGQSYLVLTSCSDTVTDDTIKAGPLIVEITNPYPSTL